MSQGKFKFVLEPLKGTDELKDIRPICNLCKKQRRNGMGTAFWSSLNGGGPVHEQCHIEAMKKKRLETKLNRRKG